MSFSTKKVPLGSPSSAPSLPIFGLPPLFSVAPGSSRGILIGLAGLLSGQLGTLWGQGKGLWRLCRARTVKLVNFITLTSPSPLDSPDQPLNLELLEIWGH